MELNIPLTLSQRHAHGYMMRNVVTVLTKQQQQRILRIHPQELVTRPERITAQQFSNFNSFETICCHTDSIAVR